MRYLELPVHVTSIEKMRILKQIETLKFSAPASLFGGFFRGIFDSEEFSLPFLGTLPQLKSLTINSNLLEESYERISNMKGIKKLNLFINGNKAISHLNKYIYTNCLNLDLLILNIDVSSGVKDYLDKIHLLSY
ncbi:unnamed protein product, partial [marine sediment metagenome]